MTLRRGDPVRMARARAAARGEMNGLQAHAIAEHGIAPEVARAQSVTDLARDHARIPHEHMHPHRVAWNTIPLWNPIYQFER